MKGKNIIKGSYLLRKGRYSSPGHYYFITTSTFNKTKIFIRPEHFQTILDSLMWLEQQERIELHFVIAMPDHIHVVFKLKKGQTLSRVMTSFKGYTGRKIKKILDNIEPKMVPLKIWQNQYYDHLIRKDESYTKIMRYCLYNPVRKGIVDEPQKYPFWWCKYDLL